MEKTLMFGFFGKAKDLVKSIDPLCKAQTDSMLCQDEAVGGDYCPFHEDYFA